MSMIHTLLMTDHFAVIFLSCLHHLKLPVVGSTCACFFVKVDEHTDSKMKQGVPDSINTSLEKSDMVLDDQQDPNSCKRRKLSLPTAVSVAEEDGSESNGMSIIANDYVSHSQAPDRSGYNHGTSLHKTGDDVRNEAADTKKEIVKHASCSKNLPEWKPLEKELYSKGVEIFGRNRYGF